MLSAAAFAAAPIEAPLWWRMPTETEVKWRGMLPTEGGVVGTGRQIGLYPAPNAAGLLAAILTHAAIADREQSSEYRQVQQASDRVLAPYAAALGAWSATHLMEAAVAAAAPSLVVKIWDGQAPTGTGAVVQTAPTFTLALDESVVILDVAIKLGASGAEPVETLVRVISTPLDGIDPRTHWSADESHKLKSTAAAMLAYALEMAHRYAISSAEGQPPMRTHRYMLGPTERTERAQELAGNCARLVLRNLRGALMSVPIRAESESKCQSKVQF